MPLCVSIIAELNAMKEKFSNLRNSMKNTLKEALDTKGAWESKFYANRILEDLNEMQCKVDLILKK